MAALPDVALTLAEVKRNPAVVGAAPFIAAQALPGTWRRHERHHRARCGPGPRTEVTDIVGANNAALARLVPGEFGVVLGGELARAMGVREGDRVTLVAPSGQVTPAGVVPRLKQMAVVGTFNSGHFEYDSALVLMHVDDAARIFRLEGPTGVRVKLNDLHKAREVGADMTRSLTGGLLVRDWTRQNATWFSAVQLEKRMMFIILTLIVAVAAFNLVSTLVMSVTDKRADIAILPHAGRQPTEHHGHFCGAGRGGGGVGTLGGLLLGLGIAFNIDVLVPALEQLFNASFLPRDIYLISACRASRWPATSCLWPSFRWCWPSSPPFTQAGAPPGEPCRSVAL